MFRYLNPKPQMMIPTGCSYVLDELYQGQCIQIGGSENVHAFEHSLNSYLYIKNKRMDGGDVNYIKITIPQDKKLVLALDWGDLTWEPGTPDPILGDYFFITRAFVLDAGAPFYMGAQGEAVYPEIEVMMSTGASPQIGWFLSTPADDLIAAYSQHFQVEVVDHVEAKFVPEWHHN